MISSGSPILPNSSQPLSSSPRVASLTRSVVLPPPQPPSKTAKGRPFSAKRSLRNKQSVPTVQPSTDEYRLQFALQVYTHTQEQGNTEPQNYVPNNAL